VVELKTDLKERPAAVPGQLDLPALPQEIEDAQTELQAVLRNTAMDAMVNREEITEEEVQRMIDARFRIVQTYREKALRLTRGEDWTLWKDREGNVVATPKASAMLKIRPWFNCAIYNHRGLDGRIDRPTQRTVEKGPEDKRVKVTVLEGLCDVRLGKDVMQGIFFSVRDDDQFIGRANREEKYGGPRPEDLWSCWRTGIDKKALAMILGFTKVNLDDLKACGIDAVKCTRGGGFGTSTDRTAGSVAEGNVREEAEKFWKDVLKRCNGEVNAAKEVMKECTAYPAGKNRSTGKDYRAFDGVSSWEQITRMDSLRIAMEKLKTHPFAGDREGNGREPGQD